MFIMVMSGRELELSKTLIPRIKAYEDSIDIFLPIEEKFKPDFLIELIGAIDSSLLGEFIHIIKKILRYKNYSKPICLKAIIGGAVYKNFSDLAKKQKNDNFYKQNALAFLEASRLLIGKNAELKDKVSDFDDIVIRNYIELLQDLVRHSFMLIQEILAYKFPDFDSYRIIGGGWGENPRSHCFSIWQAAKQQLYMRGSAHCFSDKEYEGGAIAMIRVALECKIRYAFGCYGIEDENSNFYPLPLSAIFPIIKQYKGNIKLAVSLEYIERIYAWTNIYMHSGVKAYSWLPHIIFDYLHPLFVGGEIENGFSMASGIQIKRNTIREFWKALEEELKLRDGKKLIKPDCENHLDAYLYD